MSTVGRDHPAANSTVGRDRPAANSTVGRVHPAANLGFGSPAGAGAYVRGRPSGYAAEAVALIERLAGGSGLVVDVGSGTGALAVTLTACGLPVVAVDPVANMLSRSSVPHRVQATADRLPLVSACAEVVTAATAFHWFATAEAVDEMIRVVRPGGSLVLVWNDRDDRVDFVAAHTQLVDAYAGDAPRFRSRAWQRVVDEHPSLTEVAEGSWPNPAPARRDTFVDRILSTSYIAALPDAERAQVRRQAEAIAAGLPDAFEYPYITRLWTYRVRA